MYFLLHDLLLRQLSWKIIMEMDEVILFYYAHLYIQNNNIVVFIIDFIKSNWEKILSFSCNMNININQYHDNYLMMVNNIYWIKCEIDCDYLNLYIHKINISIIEFITIDMMNKLSFLLIYINTEIRFIYISNQVRNINNIIN